MLTPEQAKELCQLFAKTAEEVQGIVNDAIEERNQFAMGFLQYVESTYTKQGDKHYFKIEGLTHINRSLSEVMDNYIYFLEKNNPKKTTT